jgi:hypothetical protein
LEQATNVRVAGKKPVIRILHNMARSGGTVISKCLGCMENVVLLSEIHPLGATWFNPLDQAREWYKLLTDSDIEQVQKAGGVSFNSAITLIYERAVAQDKTLIIRDWSHLDYTAVPFVENPVYRLAIAETLQNDFRIKHKATVRHPVDQWLSLRQLDAMRGKITLEAFLVGYRKFAEACRDIGFVRYEDFTRSPEESMKTLCESLDVSYDAGFIKKWWRYTNITGDTNSKRGAKREIKQTRRQEIETGLLEQFERNPDYIEAIEILGYHHPKKPKKIMPIESPKRKSPDSIEPVKTVYPEFIEENKRFWDAFSPSSSELKIRRFWWIAWSIFHLTSWAI